MMILISGQPGNGKTLRALALTVEEYERNQSRVKEGMEKPRDFYSNIRGVTFDWMKEIPRNEAGDPDYRLCNDGAWVVFDEAHSDGVTDELKEYGRLFPSTGKPGESDDGRIRSMSTHRHRGFDLVFVTQWPSKIHHQVRTLVGRHIHMNRSMGLNVAGTFTWQRVQADPYDEKQREKAEEEMWSFPKSLFDKYRSATLHTSTYKFKIPGKVWSALSVAVTVCLIAWAAYAYSVPDKKERAEVVQADQVTGGGASQAAPGRGAPPVGAGENLEQLRLEARMEYLAASVPRRPDAPWSAPLYDGRQVVAEPRAFCMASEAGLDGGGLEVAASCSCTTEQGTEYVLADKLCRMLAARGEPYNPYRKPEERRERLGEVDRGAGDTPAATASPADPVGVGKADELQAEYGAMRPAS